MAMGPLNTGGDGAVEAALAEHMKDKICDRRLTVKSISGYSRRNKRSSKAAR